MFKTQLDLVYLILGCSRCANVKVVFFFFHGILYIYLEPLELCFLIGKLLTFCGY